MTRRIPVPHSSSPVTPPFYLALDQGGHASRALVFDRQGACLAEATVPVAVSEPAADRVEHDAEEVIASLRTAAAQVVAALGDRAANLVAAGLATQRASVVCWDRHDGTALTPVLSWRDRRAAAALTSLTEHAGAVRRRTGLRLSPHYGASKLRWCLEQVPAVREAQARGTLACGPLASFILFRLLEERPLLADAANASRSLLWNPAVRDWDPWLLDLFGVPRQVLPACVATRHAFGTLRVSGCNLPLTVVTGDQSAALFAGGAPQADSIYINLGTGAFAQRFWPGSTEDAPEELLLSVVRQESEDVERVLEGTVNGAAGALEARARQFEIPPETLYRELPCWLDALTDPPLYLNGDGGLGTPWWIADFSSRYVGAGDVSARLVAVVESVVFLLRVVIDRMKGGPMPPCRLVVSGGLAMLDGLCRRLADLCDMPVLRPVQHEATARGLAFLLNGCPGQWPEPALPQVFEPRHNAPLAARFARWHEAMQAAVQAQEQAHA